MSIKATLQPLESCFDLESRWRTLAQTVDNANFFLDWRWVNAAVNVASNDCWLAEVTERNTTIALGIFSVMTEKRHGLVRARQLRLHEFGDSADSIFAEYNGLLCAKNNEERAWRVLMSTLIDSGPVWDECILHFAPKKSIDRIVKGAGLHHIRAASGSARVDLKQLRDSGAHSLDEYLATLSSSTRQQIRRSFRLFEDMGRPTLTRATTVEVAMDWLGEISRLHTQKWNARAQKGFANSHYLQAFHQQLVHKSFDEKNVELLKFHAGDVPVGYLYNFVFKKQVLFNVAGFHAFDDQRLKPGLCAHALAIVDHIQSGSDLYDFLAGDDRYKYSLGEPGPKLVGLAIQRARPGILLERGIRFLKHAARSPSQNAA